MVCLCNKAQNAYQTQMSEHHIKHRWREEIILPVRCISNNIDFLCNNKESRVIISVDGVKANVKVCKEIHLCDLESEVQRLYSMSVWDFMLKWYSSGEEFYSSYFIYIKSEKLDVQ